MIRLYINTYENWSAQVGIVQNKLREKASGSNIDPDVQFIDPDVQFRCTVSNAELQSGGQAWEGVHQTWQRLDFDPDVLPTLL